MTQISQDAFMKELLEIKGTVSRTEGQVATFVKQMEVQDNRTSAIDGRVRSVENKQYWISGAGAIVGMILGALGLPHLKT